ncbi:C-_U-editing enzyme APOBEC-1 isoform X2 [Eublepharis macularius]|uniref:C->U-editing enzyme APOBEC-1 isoform X2 n=1 Tax=Eublepharis macularius TaxID=481883 RepID=A0AA97JYJ1_EUBMA|nr:C->U-editing enzyme APOBEC-1 isoform X2 [Eublepharis macularius]
MALQLAEEKGQLDSDTSKGWRIKPENFKKNYTPVEHPKGTFLLYEIRWGKSPKTWKKWCTNDDNHHAEINFIEKAWQEKNCHRTMPCSVTWFLSWSPCEECSWFIIEFLKKYPKVTLDIRASRLYRDCEQQTGLKELVKRGVNISIMHMGDYNYCWRIFVDHQRNQDQDNHYMGFSRKICDWNEKLHSILE